MAIHGNKLITLSLPNIVVRLSDNKRVYDDGDGDGGDSVSDGDNMKENSYYYQQLSPQPQTTTNKLAHTLQDLYLSDSVNVSFIDNNDVLKLLSFQYSYDLSDSKIEYSHQIQHTIKFNSLNDYF